MAINYTLIGRNVQHDRLQKELKRAELAEKIHVTEQYIRHIECDRAKLSLPLLVGLSEVLLVDVRLLLGLEDSEPELDTALSELFINFISEKRLFCIEICKTPLSFHP